VPLDSEPLPPAQSTSNDARQVLYPDCGPAHTRTVSTPLDLTGNLTDVERHCPLSRIPEPLLQFTPNPQHPALATSHAPTSHDLIPHSQSTPSSPYPSPSPRPPNRYEASALTLRSLRREVLCLLSASSKVMADPQALLGQALDPPHQEVVAAALDYLQQVRHSSSSTNSSRSRRSCKGSTSRSGAAVLGMRIWWVRGFGINLPFPLSAPALSASKHVPV